MKITMIGCPFRTTYGDYISSLRSGLERLNGLPVQWVSSNCGCGDPVEKARQFRIQDSDYFEMRSSIAGFNFVRYSPNPIKQAVKCGIRNWSNHNRAARYVSLASDAHVIHFHQTLAAFGSDVTFRLLRQPVGAARVITIHELDAEQIDSPKRNQAYNLADAIIVHDSLLKEKLVSLGVELDRVHVLCCGTDLTEGENVVRDGIVFYGGHHLDKSKGLEGLFQAYRHLKDRKDNKVFPRLRIHGHYGETPPGYAIELAKQVGIADDIDWLNTLSIDETARLYRQSLMCVLPFTRSFAGLPVGIAAANSLPIIATRVAGIPDHIGDLGIWISGDDLVELATRMDQIITDDAMRQGYGMRLRAHAEQYLGWDKIARDTLNIYHIARERAESRRN